MDLHLKLARNMMLSQSETCASLVSLASSKNTSGSPRTSGKGSNGPVHDDGTPTLDHVELLNKYLKNSNKSKTSISEISSSSGSMSSTDCGSTISAETERTTVATNKHEIAISKHSDEDNEKMRKDLLVHVSNLKGHIIGVFYAPKNWRFDPERGFDFLMMSKSQRNDHYCHRGLDVTIEEQATKGYRNLIWSLDKAKLALFETNNGATLAEEDVKKDSFYYSSARRAKNFRRLNFFLCEIEAENPPINPTLSVLMEKRAIRSSDAFREVSNEFRLMDEIRHVAIDKKREENEKDLSQKMADLEAQMMSKLEQKHNENKLEIQKMLGEQRVENLALHTHSYSHGVQRFKQITERAGKLNLTNASELILNRAKGGQHLPFEKACELLGQQIVDLGKVVGPTDMRTMLLGLVGQKVDPQAELTYTHSSTLNFERVIDGCYGSESTSKRRGSRGGDSANSKSRRKEKLAADLEKKSSSKLDHFVDKSDHKESM